MGAPIQVVDREENEIPRNYQPPPLDPRDLALFSAEDHTQESRTDGLRSAHHLHRAKHARNAQTLSSAFTFVTKRKFISNPESKNYLSDHEVNKRAQAKYQRLKKRRETGDAVGREIKAIENSFGVVNNPPVHPTKKGDPSIKPTHIYDLIPLDGQFIVEGKEKRVTLFNETFVEFQSGEKAVKEGSFLRSFSRKYHDVYLPKGHIGEEDPQFEWSAEYTLQPTPKVSDKEYHLVMDTDSEETGEGNQSSTDPKRGKIMWSKYTQRLKLSLRINVRKIFSFDLSHHSLLCLNVTDEYYEM